MHESLQAPPAPDSVSLEVLADLFEPCDALPADIRIAISTLVAPSGSPLPVLPGQLASTALPPGRAATAEIVALIGTAEPRTLLASITELRFVDVVPGTARLASGPGAQQCPPRLLALLERQRCRRWSDLAPLQIGAIHRWSNAGPASVMTLLRLAMEATVAADVTSESSGGENLTPDPSSIVDDFAAVIHHPGAGELRAAMGRLAQVEGIAAAAARLLAVPAPPQHPEPLLAALGQILATLGSDRGRAAFEQLDLPVVSAPTGASVADALVVTYERIRQLRSRGRLRVRAAVDALGPTDPLIEAITSVSDQLGSAAPLHAVDHALHDAGLPNHLDTRSQLVLHLAGPFRPVRDHPGWVATAPAELTAATDALLREDGGVHLVDQLVKELDLLGVMPAHAHAWILDHPVRELGALAVLISGHPLQVAERALNALGTPLSTTELARWIVVDRQPPAFDTDRLFGFLMNDRRFHRVGPDQWELVEWGSDPYVDIDESFLDDDLTDPESHADAGRRVGADSDGIWWIGTEVTPEVLAGTPGEAPMHLVRALGIAPDDRKTFESAFGPVTLANDTSHGGRGSVRPIALATGCRLGDTLMIGFRPPSAELMVQRLPAGVERLPFPTT